MNAFIMYHPPRVRCEAGKNRIYHDGFGGGNSDPYVWNERFLHSFCHITQLPRKGLAPGDLVFWVSGDTFPEFTGLWCDLVFEIEEIVWWPDANRVRRTDAFVESDIAYREHYLPGCSDHPLKRGRCTLKAHPRRSFQPQTAARALVDIVPILRDLGVGLDVLRPGLRAGFAAKPMPIEESTGAELYRRISAAAAVRLRGADMLRFYEACSRKPGLVRARCGC